MELLVIYISVFHLSTFYDYSYPPLVFPFPRQTMNSVFATIIIPSTSDVPNLGIMHEHRKPPFFPRQHTYY